MSNTNSSANSASKGACPCFKIMNDAKSWDKRSARYERFTGTLSDERREFIEKVREFGVEFEGKTLLDIGAGTGVYSLFLAQICKFVTATDVSEKMIEILKADAAKFGISNLEAFVCDFCDFLPKKRYDIAFLTMSPALKSEKEMEKFLNLGEKHVFKAWRENRISSLFSHFVSEDRRKMSANLEDFEQFLAKNGVKYQSFDFDEIWEKERDVDDAFSDVSWHMELNKTEFDAQILRSSIAKLIAKSGKNGKILDKNISKTRLLVF